jgi:hypothetical protein
MPWHGDCETAGMEHLDQTLRTHPQPRGIEPDLIIRTLPTLMECAASCAACADACLGEPSVDQLRSCIASDLACAELCRTVSTLLLQQTAPDPTLLRETARAAETACRLCAQECEKHASMHAHCKACAAACRRCEEACQKLAA